jgi:hypothetical protein
MLGMWFGPSAFKNTLLVLTGANALKLGLTQNPVYQGKFLSHSFEIQYLGDRYDILQRLRIQIERYAPEHVCMQSADADILPTRLGRKLCTQSPSNKISFCFLECLPVVKVVIWTSRSQTCMRAACRWWHVTRTSPKNMKRSVLFAFFNSS